MTAQRSRHPYDGSYDRAHAVWGAAPSALVQQIPDLISLRGAHVLDAGAGQGRNARFLAAYGCTVHAVEPSDAARQAWTDDQGSMGTVEWSNQTILGWQPRTALRAVVAYGLLHCLASVGEIETTVARFLRWSEPGGIIVVCAFNDREHTNFGLAHPGFNPTLLAHSAYVNLFRDHSVLSATDTDLEETHPDLKIVHTHSMTRMLIRVEP